MRLPCQALQPTQFLTQVIHAMTDQVFVGPGVTRLVLAQAVIHEGQTRLEALVLGRGVENDVGKLLP